MKTYNIRTTAGGTILFSGLFTSMKDCLQAAIHDRIPLHHADLRSLNLLNAELDGADLRYASFSGSNLSGANLSEALLDHVNFGGTTMFGTVLCESRMPGCYFGDTQFGGTDIGYSDIAGSTFTTLSAFDLKFQETESMAACRFINPCGTICPISRPPVVIQGLKRPVVFMDQHIKIGNDVYEMRTMPSMPASDTIQPLGLRVMLEKLSLFRAPRLQATA